MPISNRSVNEKLPKDLKKYCMSAALCKSVEFIYCLHSDNNFHNLLVKKVQSNLTCKLTPL